MAPIDYCSLPGDVTHDDLWELQKALLHIDLFGIIDLVELNRLILALQRHHSSGSMSPEEDALGSCDDAAPKEDEEHGDDEACVDVGMETVNSEQYIVADEEIAGKEAEEFRGAVVDDVNNAADAEEEKPTEEAADNRAGKSEKSVMSRECKRSECGDPRSQIRNMESQC
ncbi:hypothetical protein MTO96_000419 [Rhipicephalus appendiculatus]